MKAKINTRKIRLTGLCLVLCGGDGIAHTAPHIDFISQVRALE